MVLARCSFTRKSKFLANVQHDIWCLRNDKIAVLKHGRGEVRRVDAPRVRELAHERFHAIAVFIADILVVCAGLQRT